MKTILARKGSQAKDSDAFYFQEQPIPEPGPKDLLVRLAAIGMNPVDTKVRVRTQEDRVLGWDGCGIVEKIGTGVTDFKKGDKVYYAGELNRPGTNSEYHLVDYRITAHAPKALSPEDAAAMPLTSITAWEGLFDRLGFTAEKDANRGKNILIIGGAGGVGSVAIQLARWAGLTVYATASRPDTVDWCKNLGADTVLNHRNNLAEELKAAGADKVDAIYCATQMEQHWKAMAECIRPQGRIVLIDDPAGPVDITVFKLKSIAIFWEFMYTRSMFATEDIGEQGKLLATEASLLDNSTLVTTRQKTLHGLTPENIQAMHIHQESGTMMGKQVLVI
ncbi:zinc-binding alcohol dehydrogenase family protein [Desulfopila sp. IMCC35006]|uniref:zinc-binding alcohol dehydrogenase family protein n=1 Tax=Desulfopila sp. IMCC35006 TaxID=2569542 RepID=UPI0010AD0384|nr:zinc-binding alcohol dehydrogenase family protein [Desulfopila sp. IMCC35006]TKB25576.1 zinc-binding alcohol dehydrogenase family protein [Desulfopila sp. IMCC35006]